MNKIKNPIPDTLKLSKEQRETFDDAVNCRVEESKEDLMFFSFNQVIDGRKVASHCCYRASDKQVFVEMKNQKIYLAAAFDGETVAHDPLTGLNFYRCEWLIENGYLRDDGGQVESFKKAVSEKFLEESKADGL